MERIVHAGDWHSNTQWMQRCLKAVAAAGLTYMVHVGDFGALWPGDRLKGSSFTARLTKDLHDYGITLVFVDGNHDHHPALRALELNDEGFGYITDQLLYAPRGHRWTLQGLTYGALGGAHSINKRWLKAGENWWPEEDITDGDVRALGADPLDVLITHDVPAGIDLEQMFTLPEALERESHANRIRLLDAARATNPQLVFAGHWHQRRTQLLRGSETRVHVLHKDGHRGNMATLDPATMLVEPFEL